MALMNRSWHWRLVVGSATLVVVAFVYVLASSMKPSATVRPWRDVDVSKLAPGGRIAIDVDGLPVWIIRRSAANGEAVRSAKSDYVVLVPRFEWRNLRSGWRGYIPVRTIEPDRLLLIHHAIRDQPELAFEDATDHGRYFDSNGKQVILSFSDTGVAASDLVIPPYSMISTTTVRVSTRGLPAELWAVNRY